MFQYGTQMFRNATLGRGDVVHKQQRSKHQCSLDRKDNITEMAENKPDPKASARFRAPAYNIPIPKKRIDVTKYMENLGANIKGEMSDGQDSPE